MDLLPRCELMFEQLDIPAFDLEHSNHRLAGAHLLELKQQFQNQSQILGCRHIVHSYQVTIRKNWEAGTKMAITLKPLV